jgi:mono/diheme cytochrome c family protein
MQGQLCNHRFASQACNLPQHEFLSVHPLFILLNYIQPRQESFKMTNKSHNSFILFICAGLFLLAGCGGQPSAPVQLPPHTPSATVRFSKDVLPIFQEKCINCHGGEKTSKGLDLKTYASLMAGSQNGAMIVPSDPTNSKLLQSVLSGKMPKRGPALPSEQIQLLMDWVSAGAKNN